MAWAFVKRFLGPGGSHGEVVLAFVRREREPVARCELVAPQFNLTSPVDFAPQKFFLARQGRLVQDYGPAAGFSVPAIPAAFQNVFEIEGRIFCPELVFGLASIAEQQAHRDALGARQRLCEEVEEGVAIVYGTVAVMEMAVVVQEIAKLASFVAFLLPGDLCVGASPIEIPEKRPGGFAHRAVEFGVVGDNQGSAGDEGFDGCRINRPAGDLLVRDTSDGGDERRDGLAGLPELAEGIQDPVNLAVAPVLKLDHAELDDFIGAGRHSCGFGVENDPDKNVCGRFFAESVLGRQAAQHAIISAGFEDGSKAFQDDIPNVLHSTSVIRDHTAEKER